MATATDRAPELDQLAINTIRALSIDGVQKANSGHPGAPLGLAPLGYVLYTRIMRHNPANPDWPNRDRFVLSNGHASMLQYSLLHLCGYDVSLEDLKQFRQWGSKTPGHPEYGHTPGVEVTTGPLGQGFANAVGFALAEAMYAERFNRTDREIVDHHTYVIVSDGDMEEGMASEAASLAGNFGLGKLITIYDDNKVQLSGPTKVSFSENVPERFSSYGWGVHQLGEDVSIEEIELAIEEAKAETERPSLIALPTHIGFGSPKQDSSASHGSPLGEEDVKLTKEALGWPSLEPFFVPDEVRELFAAVPEEGKRLEAEWTESYERYAQENPELAEQFERSRARHEPTLPPISEAPKFSPSDDPIATRAASGKAINWLAPQVPELVGGSADLAGSTKTMMDGEAMVLRHEFRGRNLDFGVREHAMGAIVNALTIEGMRAYAATFFCFSDYMRGAVRLAAVMGIPTIFVWTHDSFWLGEDGTTHQPVEHLASLRAMPVIEVIRPADVNETFLAWHWLMGRCNEPTALILTRQGLPVMDREQIPDDAIDRGAYIYRDPAEGAPAVVLVGTGSEVPICVAAADLLDAEGVSARVVSMPCVERFLAQPEDYRDEILPPEIGARLSVEAGSTLGWNRVVGNAGASIGIDHFGASAPASVLAEKFGFTPEAVAARAKEMLEA
jgi:transketolase